MEPDLIQTLLPAHGVHLIGGTSGAGKTTLMLQMLDAMNHGLPFLGMATRQVEYLYLSCDRDHSSVVNTAARVGVNIEPHRIATMLQSTSVSMEGLKGDVLQHRRNYHRTRGFTGTTSQEPHYLVCIEGILRLMRRGNSNDYQAVADFLADLTHLSKETNCTLIGTVHASKNRERDLIYNPRERILGSVAWSAYSKTIIFIEPSDPKDPTNPGRRVWAMPRESQAQEFDFTFDELGRLEQVANAEANFLFTDDLATVPPDGEITSSMVAEWAERRNLTRRTAERWLKAMFDTGQFERVRRGVYRRIKVS